MIDKRMLIVIVLILIVLILFISLYSFPDIVVVAFGAVA